MQSSLESWNSKRVGDERNNGILQHGNGVRYLFSSSGDGNEVEAERHNIG